MVRLRKQEIVKVRASEQMRFACTPQQEYLAQSFVKLAQPIKDKCSRYY